MCDPVSATLGVISVAASSYGAISSYQSAQAQADAEKQAAKAQAAQLNEQARVANEQAGIAQIQAEEEAAKRSRLLSAEIGSSYANWAGNGLSISGNSSDTFGNILNTQVAEGVRDIDTIRDNGAVNVWSYQSQANAYKTSATNTLLAGKNKANAIRSGATTGLATGLISGTVGGVASGMAIGNSVQNAGGWSNIFNNMTTFA